MVVYAPSALQLGGSYVLFLSTKKRKREGREGGKEGKEGEEACTHIIFTSTITSTSTITITITTTITIMPPKGSIRSETLTRRKRKMR